jgi:hypothetical protein
MSDHNHPLFERFPLAGKAALSTGSVPTPYHIYDGYGAFVGGTADLSAVKALLKGERVIPVQTADGHALMGIWICDFLDASLGAHHELQCSIFVAPAPVPPVPAQPLGLLGAMLGRADVQMLCYGLWNNTPVVVAYNRELLSLNAQLTRSLIHRELDALNFSFRDNSGDLILEGKLDRPGKASAGAGIALMRQLGFLKGMRIARAPWVKMSVVNPLGVGLGNNAVAEAFNKNDANALRYFEPERDQLTFGDVPYARLGFQPRFVQFMDGFKFVYLNPT